MHDVLPMNSVWRVGRFRLVVNSVAALICVACGNSFTPVEPTRHMQCPHRAKAPVLIRVLAVDRVQVVACRTVDLARRGATLKNHARSPGVPGAVAALEGGQLLTREFLRKLLPHQLVG